MAPPRNSKTMGFSAWMRRVVAPERRIASLEAPPPTCIHSFPGDSVTFVSQNRRNHLTNVTEYPENLWIGGVGSVRGMTDLSAEDQKLVTLARAAMARTGAGE